MEAAGGRGKPCGSLKVLAMADRPFLIIMWKNCLLIAFDYKCSGRRKGTGFSVSAVEEQSYRKTNIQALRGNVWQVQESPVAALTTRILSFYR